MTQKEEIQDLKDQLGKALANLETALARIKELELLVLGLSTKKNSSNSSIAPSTDLTRKNQSLRLKSEKKVGGQPDHKGHYLKMSDTPDKVVKLIPDFCNVCGESLLGKESQLITRRQVIDIPSVAPITTEYQLFGTHCSCGHYQEGSFPQGVEAPIQYGENIKSLVIYQHSFQYIPFARLQDYFRTLWKVSISKGTMENIIRRVAQNATPVYERLQTVVVLSFFVGSDETGFKLNGKKGWFWVWQNSLVTYIVAACSRSKAVIDAHFPEGLPNSVLGSDRLAAQLSTISKGTQLCLAHLLRDLNYLIEAEKTSWATDFKTLFQDAILLKQTKSAYTKTDAEAIAIGKRLTELLQETIIDEWLKEPDRHKQTLTFFRAMSKLREGLFPFL
jgi:transposase